MATRARPWWKDLPGGTASARGRRTALAAIAIAAALGVVGLLFALVLEEIPLADRRSAPSE